MKNQKDCTSARKTPKTPKRYLVIADNGLVAYVGPKKKHALGALLYVMKYARGFRFTVEDSSGTVLTEWKRV